VSDAQPRGTLHGVIFAPYVRKVRAVLALKAIAYRQVSVMPGAMDPEFLAKSPLSKVPVWEEAGFQLPDSSAICAYLERIEPEPPLYPADARAFASALFWEEYADTRLVDAIEPVFFQRVVRPRVLRQACDEAIVRRQLEEVLPFVLDQLEALFCSPGPLRAGYVSPALEERGRSRVPDVAALAVWSPLVNLEHVGVAVDAERWPGVAAVYAAMSAQPALEPIVAGERAALAAR
jgi:glutathione S-transferase